MTKQRAIFSIAMLAAAVPVPAAAQSAADQITVLDTGARIIVTVPQIRCRQEWNSFSGPASDWVCPMAPSEQYQEYRAGSVAIGRAADKTSIGGLLSSAPITYRMVDARGRVVMAEEGIGAVEQPQTCGLPARQGCDLAVIFKPHAEPLVG